MDLVVKSYIFKFGNFFANYSKEIISVRKDQVYIDEIGVAY